MSVSDADIAFALELFADLGDLSHRKMMGGLCLYHDGTIFSVLHGDGSIWLKGRSEMAARMKSEGWEQWTSPDPKRPGAMPYWRLPDAALDDPETAGALARDALASL